jgi:hypothetical protein
MTQGPEPKPIRTGATLHTVCITKGDLATYKLFARVYGGRYDEDMNVHNEHTVTKLKMVSLYDFMLDPFKQKGHCVVMDSAYMSDAMCQVGREEWKINMVGTCQTDRCGAGPLGKAAYTGKDKEISINTHELLFFQHKSKALMYAVWGDNNFVKTLSNFHSPVILRGGMQRKRRNPQTKRRERDFSDVDCPIQQKVYCCTYHLIDKGNGNKAKYDISTELHLHGWPPKLAARFFNMNSNNAYKIFVALHERCHRGRDPMPMRECMNNLTHSLLQQGLEIRLRGVGAPPQATKNLDSTASGDGRKVRTDSNRPPFTSPGSSSVQSGSIQTPVSSISARALHYRQVAFNRLKNFQPWRNHISIPVIVDNSGMECKYKHCPGWRTGKAKRARAYTSKYICEQCTMEKGYDFWLCHTTKVVNGIKIVVDCHTDYHVENKLFSPTPPPTGSATECSVISDLTEE